MTPYLRGLGTVITIIRNGARREIAGADATPLSALRDELGDTSRVTTAWPGPTRGRSPRPCPRG